MVTKITFTNEPKLSEHEVDKDFNATRLNLLPHIRDFISHHERFSGKEVGVTFATKGISSLISFIETANEKLVLKVALSKEYAEGEALFLKVWEEAGVRVPHVLEDGRLGERSYLLMEYIDAPTLKDKYTSEELLEKGIFLEMGRLLRRMHTPEAEGYGRVMDNKPEYPNFKDWLFGSFVEGRLKYVEEHNLLSEECGDIADAREILLGHVNENTKSRYCHDDFGTNNLFATNPITVFDPSPRFNNGYLDLGRSLCNHIGAGLFPTELIEGYFGGAPYNERALHAAIFINAVMKMPYRHERNRLESIQNMQNYLIQNQNLLR